MTPAGQETESGDAGGSRVAVVTGAGQGIGRGIAGVLAGRGYRVVVVDRNRDRAERVAAELGAERVTGLVADVGDEEQVEKLATTVVERLGRWDVLVNNAGALRFGGVETTTLADWDASFDGCVKTTWLCSRAAAPRLPTGSGRIVNIISVVAQGAESRNLLAYTTAKTALVGFTRAAARELGERGITVNAVSPGAVETDAWEKFPDPDGLRAARAAVAAVGRIGSTSEIGEAVAYFAAAEAGFVTGQVLTVDGGRTDKL